MHEDSIATAVMMMAAMECLLLIFCFVDVLRGVSGNFCLCKLSFVGIGETARSFPGINLILCKINLNIRKTALFTSLIIEIIYYYHLF